MERWQRFALPVVILLAMLGGSMMVPWVWAAITNVTGIAVQGSSIQWNNVKDASQGDGLTSGLPATALYGYNGTNFDRLRSSQANGLAVDVTRVQGTVTTTTSGSVTPADAYANPTTATQSFSLLGVFNGSTWDRQRTASGDAMAATGMAASGMMSFNGSTWDRRRSATGDAMAATGMAASGLMGFNGSTWDRLRADTTNGLWVNVKAVPTAGAAFYAIKRTNIDNSASVNLAFGFTSKKVQVETDPANTQPIVVDWTGGTAVAPAANTAGDDLIAPGRIITLDNYGVSSISVIGVDNTSQTVYVRAWN